MKRLMAKKDHAHVFWAHGPVDLMREQIKAF